MKEYSIHPTSDVQTKIIGPRTKIWQFCIVLSSAQIGEDCNICAHCFIENDVIIGDRVTIKNGVSLFDSLRIGDGVFIGPNVTFTNELYPTSLQGERRRPNPIYPVTTIMEGAAIGGGAVILPGITVGKNALVGAGAVVTSDIPDNAIAYGNPATVRRKKV